MKKILIILMLVSGRFFCCSTEEINKATELKKADDLREWLILQEDFANLQKNHLSEKVVLEAEIRALEIVNAHLDMQANLLEKTVEKQKAENQKEIKLISTKNNVFWQKYQQVCNDYHKVFTAFFEKSPVIDWSHFTKKYAKATLENRYDVLQKSFNEVKNKNTMWHLNTEKQILSGGLFFQFTDLEIISTFYNKKNQKIKLNKIK